MEEFDFTDDEIRDQLETLGYANIPTERLQQFKLDLERLVHYERSRSNSSLSTHSYADSDRAQELKVAPVNHVSVTQQKTAPELERVVYPQPNISVYRPYERTTETGTDLQVLRTAAAEPPLVSKQQQPPPASHRQENVFIRPQSAGEQPPNNRKVVKRKTLRKQNGQLVVDESFESSEQDVSMSMEERMRQLRVSGGAPNVKRPLSAPPGDFPRPPLSARYHQGSDDGYVQSSGLIHPMSDHPHTRNVQRDDPVTRYQRYSQLWKEQQAPGEKDHRNLRWNVRGHMTQFDNVHKKNRRYFVPNNYIIPGERKHSALRWQIREDLAQGYVPTPSNFM